MPYASKKQQSDYGKKWYKNNKEEHLKNVRRNTKRRRKELELYVLEYKKVHPCFDCKESNPCCLQFHHQNPDEKDLEISRAVKNGWSDKRLQEEIEKCLVLCANCHSKRHCCKRKK